VTGDRIAVRGIQAHGHHGVYAEERATGQPFIVDVVLQLDLAPAAASDDVGDTVHYGELANRSSPRSRASPSTSSRPWPSGSPTSRWRIRVLSRWR